MLTVLGAALGGMILGVLARGDSASSDEGRQSKGKGRLARPKGLVARTQEWQYAVTNPAKVVIGFYQPGGTWKTIEMQRHTIYFGYCNFHGRQPNGKLLFTTNDWPRGNRMVSYSPTLDPPIADDVAWVEIDGGQVIAPGQAAQLPKAAATRRASRVHGDVMVGTVDTELGPMSNVEIL